MTAKVSHHRGLCRRQVIQGVTHGWQREALGQKSELLSLCLLIFLPGICAMPLPLDMCQEATLWPTFPHGHVNGLGAVVPAVGLAAQQLQHCPSGEKYSSGVEKTEGTPKWCGCCHHPCRHHHLCPRLLSPTDKNGSIFGVSHHVLENSLRPRHWPIFSDAIPQTRLQRGSGLLAPRHHLGPRTSIVSVSSFICIHLIFLDKFSL